MQSINIKLYEASETERRMCCVYKQIQLYAYLKNLFLLYKLDDCMANYITADHDWMTVGHKLMVGYDI